MTGIRINAISGDILLEMMTASNTTTVVRPRRASMVSSEDFLSSRKPARRLANELVIGSRRCKKLRCRTRNIPGNFTIAMFG
jgi:hypothetical protein